jgi:hypothetical protein
MFTVCILLFGRGTAPTETRCVMGDKAFLTRAQVTCEAAKKDPIGTCDAFHTSDGNRWFFVHQSL